MWAGGRGLRGHPRRHPHGDRQGQVHRRPEVRQPTVQGEKGGVAGWVDRDRNIITDIIQFPCTIFFIIFRFFRLLSGVAVDTEILLLLLRFFITITEILWYLLLRCLFTTKY